MISQSPLLVHANPAKRTSERYSGLWECYYDRDSGDDVNLVGGNRGEGVSGETQGSRLKNIRGFLLKRRKSPLKGWHKVRQTTFYYGICLHAKNIIQRKSIKSGRVAHCRS